MAGFNAGDLVEPLDYDFQPFCPDIRGRVPEPSDKQIETFLSKVKDLMAAANKNLSPDLSDTDPEGFLETLSSLDPKVVTDTVRSMARAYAALCSNKPSFEELMQVPMRARLLFFRWVQQEVLSPEAKTGAGTAEVKALPRAVAG